jgi:hypothetical protein
MSWGIDLEDTDEGSVEIVSGHTYNLSPMWREAGVFDDSSSDLDGMLAADLAIRAARGLLRAVADPARFRALNPSNGWGDFEGFVAILTLTAITCAEHPTAIVRWNG